MPRLIVQQCIYFILIIISNFAVFFIFLIKSITTESGSPDNWAQIAE